MKRVWAHYAHARMISHPDNSDNTHPTTGGVPSTPMDDTTADALLAFINARLGEAERLGRALDGEGWHAHPNDLHGMRRVTVDFTGEYVVAVTLAPRGEHIALHNPASVLADIAAKKKMLDCHQRVLLRKGGGADYHITAWACMTCGGSDAAYSDNTPVLRVARWPCPTLRLLAEAYDWHPDYREEWRP